jgi:hypothetical protein
VSDEFIHLIQNPLLLVTLTGNTWQYQLRHIAIMVVRATDPVQHSTEWGIFLINFYLFIYTKIWRLYIRLKSELHRTLKYSLPVIIIFFTIILSSVRMEILLYGYFHVYTIVQFYLHHWADARQLRTWRHKPQYSKMLLKPKFGAAYQVSSTNFTCKRIVLKGGIKSRYTNLDLMRWESILWTS